MKTRCVEGSARGLDPGPPWGFLNLSKLLHLFPTCHLCFLQGPPGPAFSFSDRLSVGVTLPGRKLTARSLSEARAASPEEPARPEENPGQGPVRPDPVHGPLESGLSPAEQRCHRPPERPTLKRTLPGSCRSSSPQRPHGFHFPAAGSGPCPDPVGEVGVRTRTVTEATAPDRTERGPGRCLWKGRLRA